jgi:hypothetical protein
MEAAFKMQFAAMDTLDVMKEPEAVREEYGSTPFAQGADGAPSVENGVRFVVVHGAPPAMGRSQGIDRNL